MRPGPILPGCASCVTACSNAACCNPTRPGCPWACRATLRWPSRKVPRSSALAPPCSDSAPPPTRITVPVHRTPSSASRTVHFQRCPLTSSAFVEEICLAEQARCKHVKRSCTASSRTYTSPCKTEFTKSLAAWQKQIATKTTWLEQDVELVHSRMYQLYNTLLARYHNLCVRICCRLQS